LGEIGSNIADFGSNVYNGVKDYAGDLFGGEGPIELSGDGGWSGWEGYDTGGLEELGYSPEDLAELQELGINGDELQELGYSPEELKQLGGAEDVVESSPSIEKPSVKQVADAAGKVLKDDGSPQSPLSKMGSNLLNKAINNPLQSGLVAAGLLAANKAPPAANNQQGVNPLSQPTYRDPVNMIGNQADFSGLETGRPINNFDPSNLYNQTEKATSPLGAEYEIPNNNLVSDESEKLITNPKSSLLRSPVFSDFSQTGRQVLNTPDMSQYGYNPQGGEAYGYGAEKNFFPNQQFVNQEGQNIGFGNPFAKPQATPAPVQPQAPTPTPAPAPAIPKARGGLLEYADGGLTSLADLARMQRGMEEQASPLEAMQKMQQMAQMQRTMNPRQMQEFMAKMQQAQQPEQPQRALASPPGYAMGGYAEGGRFLSGEGDGVSDDIDANIDGHQPAKLSSGEFVIPARIVSELGNGSSEAGAKALHEMMQRIDSKRRKTKDFASDSKARQHLPA
jgi:hypothetical protein